MWSVDNKLADLVDMSPKMGAFFHHLGINFYVLAQQTLAEVCRKKGLNIQKIAQDMEIALKSTFPPPLDLQNLSVELIVAYLQQTHRIFIRQKLPYLAYLIKNLPKNSTPAKEIDMIFPLFLKDFIEHIHEEEDISFAYMLKLQGFVREQKTPWAFKEQIESRAAKMIQTEHGHDDELLGLSQLTDELFTLSPSWEMRLLKDATAQLRTELNAHAKIEDDILIPKAILLEEEALFWLKNK